MAQSFSFGFNEDIESDPEETGPREDQDMLVDSLEEEGTLLAPRLHTLAEILDQLPSSIAYTTHQGPLAASTLCLPRRELFDIRTQAMAEGDLSDPAEYSTAGLLTDDILNRVYEGGFKTWECSIDLARYLTGLIRSGALQLQNQDMHIIELGTGTALPTATLVFHLLQQSGQQKVQRNHIHLTLADYNSQVLALATIPNLLLTIASVQPSQQPWKADAEIEISPVSIASYLATLSHAGISLSAISGAWGPAFVDLARHTGQRLSANGDNATAGKLPASTLILASETIYCPASLREFTRTVLALLDNGTASSSLKVALIAAKRVYFGVGGGVDEFLAVLEELGGHGRCVWDSREEEEGSRQGVGRCILEVYRR